jgi:hypothetical protein
MYSDSPYDAANDPARAIPIESARPEFFASLQPGDSPGGSFAQCGTKQFLSHNLMNYYQFPSYSFTKPDSGREKYTSAQLAVAES